MKLIPILAASAFLAAASAASAQTVTFGGLPGSNLDAFSSYSESGFTVTKTAGDVYVGANFGNPAPSLIVSGLYGGSPSGTLGITYSGGTFGFGGFDISASGVAAFVVTGTLAGSQVFSIASSHSGAFYTLAGAGGGPIGYSNFPIDALSIELTSTGASLNLDNIYFVTSGGAVPEPATWTLMIVGFGLIGGALRHRDKVKVTFDGKLAQIGLSERPA